MSTRKNPKPLSAAQPRKQPSASKKNHGEQSKPDFKKSAFSRESKNRPQTRTEAPGAGKLLTAKISSLSYGGYGVSKDKDGILFVHRGIPGDELKVRTLKYKKGYGTCEISEVVKGSEHRKNAHCKGFDAGCGGCQWLHMDYAFASEWKTRLVRETLKHIGKISVEVKPVIKSDNPQKFRNKLSLQLKVRQGLCGMMVENSHTILNIESCKLVMDACSGAYETIKKILSENQLPDPITQIHIRAATDGSCGLYIFAEQMTNKIKAFSDRLMKEIPGLKGVGLLTWKDYHNLSGIPYIEESIRGIAFRIPHNGFFQTNYRQAAVLMDLVHTFLKPGPNDDVLDLYCGTGFFSLDLAKKAKTVTGIENNEDSVRYAVKNALNNKIKNAHFIAEDSAIGMEQYQTGAFSMAVIDPPRMGCESRALAQLIRLKPKKIAYVSCAPDTLSRDLFELTQAGYGIDFCQPVDMFPHTYHIEVVTGLSLR